jgi:hypothetical protein
MVEPSNMVISLVERLVGCHSGILNERACGVQEKREAGFVSLTTDRFGS